MSSANGVLSPPLHSESSISPSLQPAKRKRDDASELLTNGIANSNSESTEHTVAASKSLVRDLIDVLKEHDTTPSILEYPISERLSSSGPQAKRQKAEDKDIQQSILTRQSGDVYKNIDEVLEDITLAVSGIMEALRIPSGNVRLSAHHSTVSMKVKAFQQRAHELVKREKTLQEENAHVAINGASSPKYGINGGASGKSFTQINAGTGDSKMVLTLYGGASGPKQMFSSLQIPAGDADAQRDIVQILREVGLPNGITTTQIVPVEGSGNTADKKRVPTLGDLFPTPSTVPSLLPPKPSKIATTRSGTVGFYQPSLSEPLTRSASYSRQSISFGHWIDYSNVSTSPHGIKRKRDRALSLVGTKAPPEPEPVESEGAKLDALFRSAYSGFAPTRDDGAAIAPAGILSRVWWQKVGEENFEKMVESATLDTTTNENSSDSMDVTETFSELELEQFEKMVEELENDGVDPTLVPLRTVPEKSAEEKDVEEILQGISELLETLNSYQRIRHMSLNSSSRPAGLLSAPDTTSLGTPTKPSEPEQATYEILKSQLTLMIATLPPYAVAKLDADRLAELSISTKIEVQLNDYKGVMEEDEAATRAKVAALTASSSASRIGPPATAHRASSTSLYGNQYAPSRTGPAAPNQYYSNAQTPIRPPSSNLQRPPATAPVAAYQPQRTAVPAPAAYRPNPAYGTPTTYQHQAPRPAQQAYGSTAQQYVTNSLSQAYMQPPSQGYQHAPQTLPGGQMNARYPNQPAYPHQTPTQQNNIQYRYSNGAAFPRQASPQKPVYSPQPASAQPRPSYSTPTPAIPQTRPYIQTPMGQQQMMNGTGSQSPAPQYPVSSGNLTQPYSTFMTQQEQSKLMERQRSLLAAQQQQTQQDARKAAMGGASSGQVNGTSAVAAGL